MAKIEKDFWIQGGYQFDLIDDDGDWSRIYFNSAQSLSLFIQQLREELTRDDTKDVMK